MPWPERVGVLDPHAFDAGILGADGGRAKVLRRLGAEAEDVLDEFLAQALAFEEANTPSLEAFLAWWQAADTDVRRDTDSIRDEVRVMTVHGAKGLEAPIVFLVDNGSQPVHPNHDPKIVSLVDDRDGTPSPIVWARSARHAPAAVRARLEALRTDARNSVPAPPHVAVTRAEDRLYVCGTEKQVGDPLLAEALAQRHHRRAPGRVRRERRRPWPCGLRVAAAGRRRRQGQGPAGGNGAAAAAAPMAVPGPCTGRAAGRRAHHPVDGLFG